MEYGRDYYAGEKLDDHCEKYALVIWENGGDVENQCCCVNIKKIWIPEMLTNSKLYGPIDVYVVGWKGYNINYFEEEQDKRVLATGGLYCKCQKKS